MNRTGFFCPHCRLEYNDYNDEYLERINCTQRMATRIKCRCLKSFYLTYNSECQAITYKTYEEFKANNYEILPDDIKLHYHIDGFLPGTGHKRK